MKRADLIRHLHTHNCFLVREGGNHSLYSNLTTVAISTIPRHREIKKFLVKKICKDLEIPVPLILIKS